MNQLILIGILVYEYIARTYLKATQAVSFTAHDSVFDNDPLTKNCHFVRLGPDR